MAEEQSVEVDAKEGRFKVSGTNVINLLTFVFVILLSYGGWMHVSAADKDTQAIASAIKESSATQAAAIKESTATQKQLLDALHEQNCLARLPANKRESDVEFCRNLGRGR